MTQKRKVEDVSTVDPKKSTLFRTVDKKEILEDKDKSKALRLPGYAHAAHGVGHRANGRKSPSPINGQPLQPQRSITGDHPWPRETTRATFSSDSKRQTVESRELSRATPGSTGPGLCPTSQSVYHTRNRSSSHSYRSLRPASSRYRGLNFRKKIIRP